MTFGVDLRDIQPYNSETHHYYTESEQQNYNDRRKTAQGITCEFLIESDHSQDYGNDEHDIAEGKLENDVMFVMAYLKRAFVLHFD